MHCDVLIAGGGPAGLAAAIALRQRGADVLLADALRPPIDKACGEGLMPDSHRDLARLGVDLRAGGGAEFRGMVFADEGARVSADFPQGPGIGMRRTALQRLLVDRASELGVRMLWNTPLLAKNGRLLIAGNCCPYQWLVGADGLGSRLRAWAGLETGTIRSRRYGFRAHFRVAPWSPHVEVHWGRLGQACITPVGSQEISVSAMSRIPGVRLGDVVGAIPFLWDKLAGAAQTTRERGSLTVTRQLARVTLGNVALVGDASGSIDAITGEGLALGFRQALLLAESLEAGGLEPYEAGHSGILALPRRMAALLLRMDGAPWLRRRALEAMAARPELFRGLLAVHVGHEPLSRFVLRHGAKAGILLLPGRRQATGAA